MAERLVWEFISELPEESKFDAVSINPGFLLGPIISMPLKLNHN